MALRKTTVTISNLTSEALTLHSSSLSEGTWTIAPHTPRSSSDPSDPDTAVPADFVSCACSATEAGTGASGSVTYGGPSGSFTITWSNPASGENTHSSSVTGLYTVPTLQGNQGTVLNVIGSVQKGQAVSPAAPPAATNQAADDHSHPAHVPLKSKSPVVISPKSWLVDIAWQAVDHIEWDALILEITENRHGIRSSTLGENGPGCPGTLQDLTRYGVARGGKCDGDHDFFYSWCGDYVSWVYWKAWFLKTDAKRSVTVTKDKLGQFLNRVSLNGTWADGQNLSMIEAYARGQSLADLKAGKQPTAPPASEQLLVWHAPGDGFSPNRGDIYFLNRSGGGHVGIIDNFDSTKKGASGYQEYVSLDGKSFDKGSKDHGDPGWFGTMAQAKREHQSLDVSALEPHQQGVVQNFRRTDIGETVRGFVDASKLRAALGYR